LEFVQGTLHNFSSSRLYALTAQQHIDEFVQISNPKRRAALQALYEKMTPIVIEALQEADATRREYIALAVRLRLIHILKTS
ncbi:MAG TPA: hypothetical protein VN457_01815, partial [Chlamydiales bacterium]|nr:hypothetical protein [Chlamydiales bacterium]